MSTTQLIAMMQVWDNVNYDLLLKILQVKNK